MVSGSPDRESLDPDSEELIIDRTLNFWVTQVPSHIRWEFRPATLERRLGTRVREISLFWWSFLQEPSVDAKGDSKFEPWFEAVESCSFRTLHYFLDHRDQFTFKSKYKGSSEVVWRIPHQLTRQRSPRTTETLRVKLRMSNLREFSTRNFHWRFFAITNVSQWQEIHWTVTALEIPSLDHLFLKRGSFWNVTPFWKRVHESVVFPHSARFKRRAQDAYSNVRIQVDRCKCPMSIIGITESTMKNHSVSRGDISLGSVINTNPGVMFKTLVAVFPLV